LTSSLGDDDPPLERRVIHAILGVALLASLALKLINLGHAPLRGLDESFHAVVAANLLKHPFTPTLIDRPYLPDDHSAWPNEPAWLHAHVWLHKPILPLWQIAISLALLGVNAFALRLPSALLSTAAVWLTYAIGRELLDRRAGLVAAALQAFNPAILMLVHGYAFSDHVDVALLFWTEVSIWLLALGARGSARLRLDLPFGSVTAEDSRAEARPPSAHATRWFVLAGVAQGLAFLSKTYPALIVTGVAIVGWLLSRRRDRDVGFRVSGKHLLLLIAATILTIAPWTIYAALRWPSEFAAENLRILSHLNQNVESWAGPWDRVIFAYLLSAQYLFYTTALAATMVLLIPLWRARHEDRRPWLVYVWMLGVLVPFTLARSKTPSATLLAWPGMFLIVGALVSRATRGDALAAVTWLAATGLMAIALARSAAPIPERSFGADAPALTSFHEAPWVLWHVIAACAVGLIGAWIIRRARLPGVVASTLVVIATLTSAWLLGRTVWKSWRVTQIKPPGPGYVAIGDYARQRLPANAVLLCDEQVKLERNTLMFRADRACYPLHPRDPSTWQQLAGDVARAGGRPYLVSPRSLPLRVLVTDPKDGRTLYDLDR
jgi:4-amino-4-deoxy-L-arabinose transferase-like glycosyltransferase